MKYEGGTGFFAALMDMEDTKKHICPCEGLRGAGRGFYVLAYRIIYPCPFSWL